MKILFIGNFNTISMTGEEPDEHHIARCIEQTGTPVTKADRAEIHAYFTGAKKDNVPDGEYDIILLAKWHHITGEIAKKIKEKYKGKLVYWVWDWMGNSSSTPGWHTDIEQQADYYLSGEAFRIGEEKFRYFQFDTSDGKYAQLPERTEELDVVFAGSYIPQSYRTDVLRGVKDKFKLTIFSHDHEKWKEEGFDARPGMYGASFNQVSAMSKVMLVMNWPQPSYLTSGYQSNRVGKILTTGGLPLVHYFPMAERILSDAVMFWYKEEDLYEKIKWLLDNPKQRETQRVKAYEYGRRFYSTQKRMQELKILLESFL